MRVCFDDDVDIYDFALNYLLGGGQTALACLVCVNRICSLCWLAVECGLLLSQIVWSSFGRINYFTAN